MQGQQINSGVQCKAKRKILVLEDDEQLAELMKNLFEMTGYSYWIIGNTNNVIPLITKFKPDLVILDYLLPGINGSEICIQIKQNLCTHDVPVLIFSSYPGAICSIVDCGLDGFLPKPFELKALEEIIAKLVSRTHAI